MPAAFKDHFSSVADHYAQSRPTYPVELFDWLAAQCTQRRLAWDCGAGSGQASVELGRHFDHVIATDASQAQIAQATPHPNVEYRVAPAESSGLADRSADLVTVAQALHWFDLERFYAEVRRVLRPQGVIAAWTYATFVIDAAEVQALVQHFYEHEVGPYWPPERRHVENGYSELPFPFETIAVPSFFITVSWTVDQLLDYLRSWSATARFIQAKGLDPVQVLEGSLRKAWGSEPRREVRWPLTVLAGRC